MDFVVRLGLLYTGVFGAIGIQLPFLPIWLAAKGLDDQAIGTLLAAATIARVMTVPFATRAADRFLSLKVAILLAAAAGAVSLSALAGATGPTAILVIYVIASAASSTTLPLVETYAVYGLAARGRAYGPARVFGSVAFILGTLSAGLMMQWLAPINLIWLLAGAYWLALLAAFLLVPVDTSHKAARQSARVSALFGNWVLLGVITASALSQASHAMFYLFGTLQWRAAGLSGTTISMLWSLSILSEIVLFALSARLPAAFGPLSLLGLGACGAVLRWSGMALDPPLALLPALQVLHAFSFGATYLGAVQFIARAAPPSLAATAQGLLATANGLGMAVAMALSGALQAHFGVRGYAAMALIAAASGVVVSILLRRRPASA
ncbi:MAG: MFS transporter [Variibacter sp.]|nr:MFS transporter [Variibacter sp.]